MNYVAGAGSNAPSWAFGAGMPMGGGGLQNPARQLGGGGGGGNVSFAQSLSGSQPATPLDLSYVLSTTPPPCRLSNIAFAPSFLPILAFLVVSGLSSSWLPRPKRDLDLSRDKHKSCRPQT